MPDNELDAWSEEELEDESVLQSDESTALFGSMIVHLIIILALALVPLRHNIDEEAVVIVSPRTTQEEGEAGLW